MKNFKKVLTLFLAFSFLVVMSGVSFAGHPGHGKNACNPCAKNACNPCNPCAKNACNPCAKNACNPYGK